LERGRQLYWLIYGCHLIYDCKVISFYAWTPPPPPLPVATSKRLLKELSDVQKSPPQSVALSLVDENNYRLWQASFPGRIGTPYEGGFFHMTMEVPESYPFTPPRSRLITPIYHPNFNEKGQTCLYIEKEHWSPQLCLLNIAQAFEALSSDINPDDPLRPEIAHVYKTNRLQWEKTAREWTQLYAQNPTPPKIEPQNK
jgi:ubiquitin-conjugating enzyme E2 D